MVDENTVLDRTFVSQLHCFLSALCRIVRAPEQRILGGVDNLKSAGDLKALCDQIGDEGLVQNHNWMFQPLSVKDDNGEDLVAGARIYVASQRDLVYFIVSLEGGILSVKGENYLVSAHQGGRNNLTTQAMTEVQSLPTYIRLGLARCLDGHVFKRAKSSASTASIISQFARQAPRQMLHNEVAHHIRDALDIIESVRGVALDNLQHLGENWEMHSQYASPQQQIAFLDQEVSDTAPEVAVQFLGVRDEQNIVHAVSFIVPVGKESMFEVFVETEGLTIDVDALIFELPDYAEGNVQKLSVLSTEGKQAVRKVLMAIMPFISGRAEAKCREALLFLGMSDRKRQKVQI